MNRTRSNPFSTKYTRPGAIPFWPVAGRTVPDLVDRFESAAISMQILGPHGVGKSTLANSIGQHWKSLGLEVTSIELHSGQRQLDRSARAATSRCLTDVGQSRLVIDGFEQLHWLERKRLLGKCRQRGVPALVTCHRSLGLLTLIELVPDFDLFQRLVTQLTRDSGVEFAHEELRRRFSYHAGDFREALFDLYDSWETRAQSCRPAVVPRISSC